MARPTKYNEERSSRILKALREGNTRRASSLSAGVDPETVNCWMARYPSFSAKVAESEAAAESERVAVLAKAGNAGDWRAALAWLERRRPDDWAKRDESAPAGEPFKIYIGIDTDRV